MRTLKKLLANKIYKIRTIEVASLHGTQEHDWWLAGEYIKTLGDNKFDDDDLYIWVMTKCCGEGGQARK